jgi:hypothetical protein
MTSQAQIEQELFELTQHVIGYMGREFIQVIPIIGLLRKGSGDMEDGGTQKQ